MASGSAARRYAEVLLELALEERAVPAYRQSLEKLAAGFDRDVVRLLRDARVPLERRRAALEAGSNDEPMPIRAVLHLLLERDRIAILPDISRVCNSSSW